MQTLCSRCRHCRTIVSGKGSQFLLCQHAQEDPRYAKYPPQPVIRCAAFEAASSPPREDSDQRP